MGETLNLDCDFAVTPEMAGFCECEKGNLALWKHAGRTSDVTCTDLCEKGMPGPGITVLKMTHEDSGECPRGDSMERVPVAGAWTLGRLNGDLNERTHCDSVFLCSSRSVQKL